MALVVEDLEALLERVRARFPSLPAGEIETFPSEGTRECYLGESGRPGRLLLMQPLGPEGPYARALAKRGPGLHHVGVALREGVDFLEAAVDWRLDQAGGAVWLSRRGVGTLVELMRGTAPSSGESVVERVEVPSCDPAISRLPGVRVSPDAQAWLTVLGRRVGVSGLVLG